MTQKHLIELIQLHHKDMGEIEIRIRLDNAMREFCRKSRILTSETSFTTVSGQRYYDIKDSNVIEINSVDYNGERIERLVGRPKTRDLT